MLGFLFGSACLAGLVAALYRGGPHGGRCAHRHGGRPWDGASWVLRRVFERLDTSPGQEKVMRQAVDDVRDEARALRDEATRTRADVARAVGAEVYDEAALREAFARHD